MAQFQTMLADLREKLTNENAELRRQKDTEISQLPQSITTMKNDLGANLESVKEGFDRLLTFLSEQVEKTTRCLPFLISAEPKVDTSSFELMRTVALSKPQDSDVVDWSLLSLFLDLADTAGEKQVTKLLKLFMEL